MKTIGRYEILDQIGQGALAVGYRAHDRQLDRQVALKELKPSLLDDPTALIQIQQEARTIARLEHPHIVAIHDVYEAGDRLFIVMQLVDGSSLDRLLTGQGRLAWPETVEMVTASYCRGPGLRPQPGRLVPGSETGQHFDRLPARADAVGFWAGQTGGPGQHQH